MVTESSPNPFPVKYTVIPDRNDGFGSVWSDIPYCLILKSLGGIVCLISNKKFREGEPTLPTIFDA
jgi:hypothetical protein